ncbi:hypothetical protein NKG94_34805 [Micromonospora sp. M12]
MSGFWAELVAAWRREPRIHLREIEWSLRYAAAVLDNAADGCCPPTGPDPDDRSRRLGGRALPELAGFTDPTTAISAAATC